MPKRWIRELCEGPIDHLTGRLPPKHPAFEEVVLAAEAGGAHLGRVAYGSLVLQQAVKDVDRRVE